MVVLPCVIFMSVSRPVFFQSPIAILREVKSLPVDIKISVPPQEAQQSVASGKLKIRPSQLKGCLKCIRLCMCSCQKLAYILYLISQGSFTRECGCFSGKYPQYALNRNLMGFLSEIHSMPSQMGILSILCPDQMLVLGGGSALIAFQLTVLLSPPPDNGLKNSGEKENFGLFVFPF